MNRKTAVLMALILVFLLSMQVFVVINFRQNEKTLNSKIAELTAENTGLKDSLPDVARAQYLHQPKLSSQEIRYLKKKGLKNPVNDIIADLMKHNEFIPYQGVLGGKMGFHSDKEIYVLSTKLVRASFDDGHTGGWMMLEYQVTAGSKISWNVLESYLE